MKPANIKIKYAKNGCIPTSEYITLGMISHKLAVMGGKPRSFFWPTILERRVDFLQLVFSSHTYCQK